MPQIKRCKKCADHGISDDGHLILLRFPPARMGRAFPNRWDRPLCPTPLRPGIRARAVAPAADACLTIMWTIGATGSLGQRSLARAQSPEGDAIEICSPALHYRAAIRGRKRSLTPYLCAASVIPAENIEIDAEHPPRRRPATTQAPWNAARQSSTDRSKETIRHGPRGDHLP
jgi:hypothetical protein